MSHFDNQWLFSFLCTYIADFVPHEPLVGNKEVVREINLIYLRTLACFHG